MDIIISVIILILLCFIFIKEVKSDKPVDLFIDIIISVVCILTPLVTFLLDGFKIDYIAHLIYLGVIGVAVIFTIYYLIKYFKNKDNNYQINEEKDNVDNKEA